MQNVIFFVIISKNEGENMEEKIIKACEEHNHFSIKIPNGLKREDYECRKCGFFVFDKMNEKEGLEKWWNNNKK